MLKAYDIWWDFDKDQIFERIDETDSAEMAKIIDITPKQYESLSPEERHDLAYDKFRHCPALLDEFMGLPDEIDIPPELVDPEDISDWLSDEYGFCHEGFQLKTVEKHKIPKKIYCPNCGKELIRLEPYIGETYEAWCDTCGINITLWPDDETPVSIENDVVRADWYDAGEGICGDYNPEDPDDIPLLRFDIYKKEGEDWVEVDDASYCTRMPADSSLELLVHSLYIIFKEYNNVLKDDPDTSVKKLGEALSWICPDDCVSTYRVHYAVQAYYTTDVTILNGTDPTQTIAEIKRRAAENFSEANFGDAFNIDGWETTIETEDGAVLWKKD